LVADPGRCDLIVAAVSFGGFGGGVGRSWPERVEELDPGYGLRYE